MAADDRIIRVPPTGGSSPSAEPTPTVSPTPSVTPTVSPTPTPSGGPLSCAATYKVTSQWQGGFQGELAVMNTGTVTLASWTVAFAFPNGQVINQLWGGRVTQSGSGVTVRNETWNGALAQNASATAGFTASWTGTNAVPAPITCMAT